MAVGPIASTLPVPLGVSSKSILVPEPFEKIAI
jgi:hypothetical protein